MNDLTYLDYAASTQVDPRVRLVMSAVAEKIGNPSSTHAAGRDLRAAIDGAREQVAALLDVAASEVVFTSGATEANGLAIRGTLRAIRSALAGAKPRILVSAIEHASMLGSAQAAEADGEANVDIAHADKSGVVTPAEISSKITPETAVIAVQWANNVLGTIQPINEIGEIVAVERARRAAAGEKLPIVFVCDAVQAVRTEDVRPQEAGVDILTLSAHKIYGPKGVGAMWIRIGTPYAPPYGGGGHESGRRHGTENVEGVVGLGTAAEVLAMERASDREHALALRGRLIDGLTQRSPDSLLVGGKGVPGIAFLAFPKTKGDELALKLDMAGFAVSAGSACDAGKRKSPRALESVLDEQAALRGGIRVSYGRFSTLEDIDRLIETLTRVR